MSIRLQPENSWINSIRIYSTVPPSKRLSSRRRRLYEASPPRPIHPIGRHSRSLVPDRVSDSLMEENHMSRRSSRTFLLSTIFLGGLIVLGSPGLSLAQSYKEVELEVAGPWGYVIDPSDATR